MHCFERVFAQGLQQFAENRGFVSGHRAGVPIAPAFGAMGWFSDAVKSLKISGPFRGWQLDFAFFSKLLEV